MRKCARQNARGSDLKVRSGPSIRSAAQLVGIDATRLSMICRKRPMRCFWLSRVSRRLKLSRSLRRWVLVALFATRQALAKRASMGRLWRHAFSKLRVIWRLLALIVMASSITSIKLLCGHLPMAVIARGMVPPSSHKAECCLPILP